MIRDHAARTSPADRARPTASAVSASRTASAVSASRTASAVSASRTVVTVAAACSALLLASCGADNTTLGPQEGADLSSGLSSGETLLLFVGGPLLLLLLIGAVVWLPGMVRSTRYRSGRSWGAPPVWFAGPPDPVAAVETAEPGRERKGGASGSW